MSPLKKPKLPMVLVWVWFVGEGIWRKMRMRELDLPLIGSPTSLIRVQSDEFLPMPMPGWRVTQQRPGEFDEPPRGPGGGV